ncbi:MAG: hypothetical protein PHS37_07305, partial [Candidatus Omnitrophica bacterium]|nr:hypothetical protein [Candidatus Omnitrophota bacterium]
MFTKQAAGISIALALFLAPAAGAAYPLDKPEAQESSGYRAKVKVLYEKGMALYKKKDYAGSAQA